MFSGNQKEPGPFILSQLKKISFDINLPNLAIIENYCLMMKSINTCIPSLFLGEGEEILKEIQRIQKEITYFSNTSSNEFIKFNKLLNSLKTNLLFHEMKFAINTLWHKRINDVFTKKQPWNPSNEEQFTKEIIKVIVDELSLFIKLEFIHGVFKKEYGEFTTTDLLTSQTCHFLKTFYGKSQPDDVFAFIQFKTMLDMLTILQDQPKSETFRKPLLRTIMNRIDSYLSKDEGEKYHPFLQKYFTNIKWIILNNNENFDSLSNSQNEISNIAITKKTGSGNSWFSLMKPTKNTLVISKIKPTSSNENLEKQFTPT